MTVSTRGKSALFTCSAEGMCPLGYVEMKQDSAAGNGRSAAASAVVRRRYSSVDTICSSMGSPFSATLGGTVMRRMAVVCG